MPEVTATAVERLERGGAVMLGKLNLLEFAMGSGAESGFGPARNPWNLERDPGGSSSGSGAALAAGLTTLSQNLRRAELREQLDPALRLYATSGRFYLATDYVKAQRLRLQLQAELEAALDEADVLVCPTDSTLTPRVGEAARLKGRELMWFEYGTVNLGNLTGAPALSVPCGFTPDGMPVGLQLYARAFGEAELLTFGHAYEQSTDWHRRRPGALVS